MQFSFYFIKDYTNKLSLTFPFYYSVFVLFQHLCLNSHRYLSVVFISSISISLIFIHDPYLILHYMYIQFCFSDLPVLIFFFFFNNANIHNPSLFLNLCLLWDFCKRWEFIFQPRCYHQIFRHGGEDMIVTRTGVIQALISFIEENFCKPDGTHGCITPQNRQTISRNERDELRFVSFVKVMMCSLTTKHTRSLSTHITFKYQAVSHTHACTVCF